MNLNYADSNGTVTNPTISFSPKFNKFMLNAIMGKTPKIKKTKFWSFKQPEQPEQPEPWDFNRPIGSLIVNGTEWQTYLKPNSVLIEIPEIERERVRKLTGDEIHFTDKDCKLRFL